MSMYSLNCPYYGKQFTTPEELADDVIKFGMDPNYEVTFKGEPIGELCIDYVQL